MNTLALTDRELAFLNYVISQTTSYAYPQECESLRVKVENLAVTIEMPKGARLCAAPELVKVD